MAAATTRTISNDSGVYNRGSKIFKAIVALEIGTDDLVTGGSVVPIIELPSEAIVTSIKAINDDLDSGGPTLVADIGIWKTKKGISLDDIFANEAGTEELDIDIYVDGMTALQGEVTTLTEYLGSGDNAVDLDDRFETVRVLAGHTLVSGTMPFKYFLGLKTTVSATTPAAGGVLFEIEWIQG